MATKTDPLKGDDETKFLAEFKTKVKTEAFSMKRSLDQNNLKDALRHASNMVHELRTSALGPKNYFQLYLEVGENLRFLENYLMTGSHGRKMADLYEIVQYAGNILPRLYLLCTVASVYIKKKEAPSKDVLKDLVEMCRGVQHPTRGLFLRSYLSDVTKDKLPDTGSEYSGSRGGNVSDAVDFILQNFTEMNKLWVRMQHQGGIKEKEKNEQQRAELGQLVGKNISRLSQLDGVTLDLYEKTVLPRILEQIVNCKDVIAQNFLMECVILAFPDDYHIQTLEQLLKAVSKLQPQVRVKEILIRLMTRLSDFKESGNPIPPEIPMFNIFSTNISEIILIRQEQGAISVEDVLAISATLLNLTFMLYPEELSYIDKVFDDCQKALEPSEGTPLSSSCVTQLQKLLQLPLDTFKDTLTVLKLEHFSQLPTYLGYVQRKKFAVDFCKSAVQYTKALTTPEQVTKLLSFISPLLRDETDQPNEEADPEDFSEEQNLVASLIHLFKNDSPLDLFQLLLTARKSFGQGGTKRIVHTLPPLVFQALQLCADIPSDEDEEWPQKAKVVLKFCHETVTALANTGHSEVALKLFLKCAAAAGPLGSQFEMIAYEFVRQSFLLYEEKIVESSAQFNTIQLIIGTLHQFPIFTEENYETLITKTALYASRLLNKEDQCRAVYKVSHLFWCEREGGYKNDQRVLECLQKSLKIASSCVESNISFYVEILNEYLYYFEHKNEAVNLTILSQLIQLIDDTMKNSSAISTNRMYDLTREYMKNDPRYQSLGLK